MLKDVMSTQEQECINCCHYCGKKRSERLTAGNKALRTMICPTALPTIL